MAYDAIQSGSTWPSVMKSVEVYPEPETPSALKMVSECAARLAQTADALIGARHAHENATRDYEEAMNRFVKAREVEGI